MSDEQRGIMLDTETLTEEQLKEIEARADAATDGPWVFNHLAWQRAWATDARQTELFVGPYERGRDLEFAAHAREDIPALCRSLRAAWAANEKLREEAVNERERCVSIINQYATCRDHDQPTHCVQCDLRHKAITIVRKEK